MIPNAQSAGDPDVSATGGIRNPSRVWRFGRAEFRELGRELRLDGDRIAVEPKPLVLLAMLLERAGEVTSRDELIAAAWPGLTVGDGSLTTAISKLRIALDDRDRRIVESVPKIGYRLGIATECRPVGRRGCADTLAEGDPVPERPHWRLDRRSAHGPPGRAWRTRHAQTGERRMILFGETTTERDRLRRRVETSRALHADGERPGFCRVLECRLDRPPYAVETTDGGLELPLWLAAHGGADAVPIGHRMAIIAVLARHLADAHAAGIRHGGLRAEQILVAGAANAPEVRLASFGGDDDAATAADDVRAAGMVLFGLATGDLDRPPGPRWRDGIAPPGLAEVIAATGIGPTGAPAISADALAARLEWLCACARRRGARPGEPGLVWSGARLRWALVGAACLLFGALGRAIGGCAAERRKAETRRAAAGAPPFVGADILSGATGPGGDGARGAA